MTDALDQLQAAVGTRYEIEGRLAAGGMSSVWTARDRRHGRRVAIKTLDPGLASSVGTARFLKEIRLTAGLQHPYILPLLDSGEADGAPYYVMPLVEGESLRDRLSAGPLSVDEALGIARDVLEALDYAHARGVVHRDIKPGNLLLGPGHAIIADFGIAKALEDAGARLTSTDVSVGTPVYMSPEQVTGEATVDGRSDLYSFGCVLFEMLAGEPPFTGGGAGAVLLRRLAMTPPELSDRVPDVPPAVTGAVRTALAREPADRFPSATAFADALGLEPATVRRPGTAGKGSSRGRRIGAIAGGVVLAGALAATVFPGLRPWGGGPRVHDVDARRSFAVVPFRLRALSPEERNLAIDVADELTRQLNGWAEARAIAQVALTGIRFDEGIDDPILENSANALALARAAGVGTLVTLTVRSAGDSSFVDATLFDVRSGRELRTQPLASGTAGSEPYALVLPLAHEILGLGGASEELELLRRQSNDLTAVTRFREGVRRLERWDLSGAESDFEAALARDSTFALAHHYRALTLYWQAARDEGRGDDLGAAMARATGAAVRFGDGLSVRDSLHVRALQAFQAGEYDRARGLYRTLLARDSADVYAWLMLGSVEFRDPWARVDALGDTTPRTDVNLAMRAFRETVRLAPDFELGYGHLFDLEQEVSGAIYDGNCVGFERPGGPTIALFEPRRPERMVAFCPVVLDSVQWLSRVGFTEVDRVRGLAGADSLLRSGMASVRRWAEYAPTRSRPHEALASWYRELRSRLLESDASALRVDSATRLALEHEMRAAGARTDTSPAELARIAALQLATGDREGARAAASRALGLRGAGERVPRLIANVLVDEGRLSAAREVMAEEWGQVAVAVPGEDDEGFLPAAGVEPRLGELMVLGSAGGPVEEIQRLLGEVTGRWRELYSPEQVARLKRGMLRYVAAGLLVDDGSLQEWVGDLDGLDPLWQGFRLARSDPDAAGVQLERSVARLRSEGGPATSYYLRAILAARIVRDSLALSLFEEGDARPRSVTEFDMAWGLAISSRPARALVLERLGRTGEAASQYRRVVDAWSGADPGLSPIVARAAEAVRRLEEGPDLP